MRTVCQKCLSLEHEKSVPIASNNTATFFERYFPGLQPSALKCYVRKMLTERMQVFTPH